MSKPLPRYECPRHPWAWVAVRDVNGGRPVEKPPVCMFCREQGVPDPAQVLVEAETPPRPRATAEDLATSLRVLEVWLESEPYAQTPQQFRAWAAQQFRAWADCADLAGDAGLAVPEGEVQSEDHEQVPSLW